MAHVPLVQRDGFSYIGDSLYCEASNSNRHRRATVPELKAHFSGKNTEDQPAHWYEAQLLHYGLPPSKVKGTAYKRLSDAVKAKGGLTVPAHIKKVEAELKKEWNKKEREAKKVVKASSDAAPAAAAAAAAAAPAKGTKRKAEQASTNFSVSVAFQMSSTGAVQVDAAQPTAKKARTSKPSPSTTNTKKPTAASKEKKTPAKTQKKASSDGGSALPPKPAKPTAKAKGPAKPAAKAKGTAKPAAKPAARRTAASSSGDTGLLATTSGASQTTYDGNVMEIKSEIDQSIPQQSLGLLNGRYKLSCLYVDNNPPESPEGLSLIATLDGRNLWFKFDLGVVTGLMKIDRPYEPDEQGMMVLWRGHAVDMFNNTQFFNIDTGYRAGPDNRLYFKGGGHISGLINHDGHGVAFDAHRLPGQSMTSEISTAQVRTEWARLGQLMETSW